MVEERIKYSLAKKFVHLEHANFVQIEDCFEFGIRDDFFFVGGILQAMFLDIVP